MKNDLKKAQFVNHADDFVDIIINKARDRKQDSSASFVYFFAAKSKFAVFLMLLFGFIAGFGDASNKHYQQYALNQNSLVEQYFNLEVL